MSLRMIQIKRLKLEVANIFEPTFSKERKLRIKLGELSRPLKCREVGSHRNFNCSYYSECASFAADNNFVSFSCGPCRFKTVKTW